MFGFHVWRWGFWFRLFGWGLHVRDTTTRRLLFSERNGLTKGLRLGRWYAKLLRPEGV